MSAGHAAGWYADPAGQHEYRYYNGSTWTEHISSHGRQGVAPLAPPRAAPQVARTEQRIQRDLGKAGVTQNSTSGGGHLFNEPVLVVSQKGKVVELTNEYAIFDQNGQHLGAVRQVGQSTAKKVLRFVSNVDQFLTHKFQIVDGSGQVLMALTRPAKMVKSRVLVERADGAQIGEIKQQNMIGKIRFSMEVNGQPVGSINAENWRAWNFNIQDASGQEIARVTKTFVGLAKAMFTTADNYVVQVHRPLEEPLRSMVIAAALCIDTALKQDES